MEEALGEAERDLTLMKGGRAGDLRVAVECHSCFDWLMPAMDAFREQWEAVDLDLVSGFHPDPIGLLGERRADLVIVSRQDGRPGVAYHPLFRFQMLALMPNGHPYASKRYLRAEDFASETLVTYPIPDDRLDVVRQVLSPAGINPQRRTTDLTIAILQLVASRRGLAVLPGWAVAAVPGARLRHRPPGRPARAVERPVRRHHHPRRPRPLPARLRGHHARGELRRAGGGAGDPGAVLGARQDPGVQA